MQPPEKLNINNNACHFSFRCVIDRPMSGANKQFKLCSIVGEHKFDNNHQLPHRAVTILRTKPSQEPERSFRGMRKSETDKHETAT